MARQPTHHNKSNPTTRDDPPLVAQRPIPSLCRTASSYCLFQLGKLRYAQIRCLIRQCRQWLAAHQPPLQQTQSGSVGPPLQWWVALELRNESEHRRIRRVPSQSIKSSGPIVIPEIIELEVLRRGIPW
jgi:hypothetical protein